MFASKYILMSIKFAALLARPFVLRGKFFQDSRGVKNSTPDLRCAVIIDLGKCYFVSFHSSIYPLTGTT